MNFAQFENMSKRQIRKIFRAADESHLWPVRGRFNATERAIRRLAKLEREGGTLSSIEYAYALDNIISEIVNKAFR